MSDTKVVPQAYYSNGMTVRDLKELIKDWPEENNYGELTEVWLGDGNMHSNQVVRHSPLNVGLKDDGFAYADLLLDINV